jgi:transposase-like protein
MPTPDKPDTPTRARTREDWADKFLAALRSATVSDAARAAGVGRSTVYDRRERDSEFASAWDNVVEESVEELELEARKRAMEGSDQLLMFLLRARRPRAADVSYPTLNPAGSTRPEKSGSARRLAANHTPP